MGQIKANVVFVPATEKCEFFYVFLLVCLYCNLSKTSLISQFFIRFLENYNSHNYKFSFLNLFLYLNTNLSPAVFALIIAYLKKKLCLKYKITIKKIMRLNWFLDCLEKIIGLFKKSVNNNVILTAFKIYCMLLCTSW